MNTLDESMANETYMNFTEPWFGSLCERRLELTIGYRIISLMNSIVIY